MIVADLLLELEPDIPSHSITITSKISQYQGRGPAIDEEGRVANP